MPLKTLFLNPPSFENFDGGASSRWPATREIESYWYPVWLAYPAGMLEGSKLLDAPPHHVSADETIVISKGFDFLVLFTSTVGCSGDHGLARAIKKANPSIKIAFVGPPVTTDPDRALNECSVINFVCRREFDFSVVEYANGKPLNEILGISYKDSNGVIQHNPDRPQVEDLDAMPWATKIYRRDMDVTKYNVPFLLHPYIALYSTRGCPAQCTFCLWPQTLSGHAWRKRSTDDVASEMAKAKEYWPDVQEFFFDDDTFNIQKARTIELCAKLKPLKLTWSCTSRARGDELFSGKAGCNNCHAEPLWTEPGWNLHQPSEVCIDSFQADRGPDMRYRTSPIGALSTHFKGGFYHDGRFADLNAVVNHYNSCMNLGLSDGEKSDLIQYLLSLKF